MNTGTPKDITDLEPINQDYPVVAQQQSLSPEGLIRFALDKGTSVDALERLMAMRRELKAESARDSFFTALKSFQRACPAIPKSKKVLNKDGSERYAYAPLEVIVATVGPILDQFGLSYRLDTAIEGGNLISQCFIHHVDGHMEASKFQVPIDRSAHMNSIQQYGAAGTYAKRYAFCNALGLLTADEDTDAATEPTAEEEVGQTRQSTPPTRKYVEADQDGYVQEAPEDLPGVSSKTADGSTNWKQHVIHYGINKGKTLGSLTKAKLFGWAMNYQPQPYKGQINPNDQALRDALDEAKAHYRFGEEGEGFSDD